MSVVISRASGPSEITHPSSVLSSVSRQTGHVLWSTFHCSIQDKQYEWVQGKITSGFLSKQIQHSSKELGSISLEVTFSINSFGSKLPYEFKGVLETELVWLEADEVRCDEQFSADSSSWTASKVPFSVASNPLTAAACVRSALYTFKYCRRFTRWT